MSKRSPARSASGHRFNRSQASFCPSVRQLVHNGINGEDNFHFKASRSSQSGVLKGNRISDQVRKKQASILRIRWTCPPKFILNHDWLVATGEESEERKFQEQRESGVTDLIYTRPHAIPRCPPISLDVKEDHDDDDDHNIPIIPITPIEDDEADPYHLDPSSVTAPKKHPLGTLTDLKGLEADIGAAASAAFTALLQSNEQGSLIDTDLLIKILNDPKMVEHLRIPPQDEEEVSIPSPFLSNQKQEKFYMKQPDLDRQSVLHLNSLLSSAVKAKEGSITSEILPPEHAIYSDKLFKQVHKAAAPMVVPISEPPLPPNLEEPSNRYTTSRSTKPGFFTTTSADLNRHIISQILPPKQVHKASAQMVVPILPPKLENSVARASIIALQEEPSKYFTSRQTKPSFHTTLASPGSPADMSKLQFNRDQNYYKSLVRQHGVERQEDGKEQRLDKVQNSLSKNCRYFNSPKGCRLGLSCHYRHQDINLAHRVLEAPIAKRVKLDSKILRL